MPFEFDRQTLFLKFLKAASFVVNTLIVLAIAGVVGWYVWGLVESAQGGIIWRK